MVPQNSCPITRGVRTTRCAHPFHVAIWTSVPQIPVRRTLINTSLGPGAGTGSSMSSSPGPGFVLTNALIQPLIPDDARPSITRFCIEKNRTKIGAIAMMDAAIMIA